jgi:hypothetical protein
MTVLSPVPGCLWLELCYAHDVCDVCDDHDVGDICDAHDVLDGHDISDVPRYLKPQMARLL